MSQNLDVHGLQLIFLLLLAVVAAFAVIARKLQVPYPIMLVIVGLLLSLMPHVPRIPLNPDVIFLVFLPPLLYAAAWQTSWREFRRNLLPITMMAFALVAFTVWAVTELAGRFIPVFDWRSAFVLGAVVATTDAIAATSIAQRIGLPKRIVDLLEGESLLNDATGLLALQFGLQLVVQHETPTLTAGLLRLGWLIVAGLGVGLLLGVIVQWFERWVEEGPVEMVISLLVPYFAYLAGEGVHASGVLSVVACGLYLSRRSTAFYSPESRIEVGGGWSAFNFILNGLVFVLIGLQLPYVVAGLHGYSRPVLVLYGGVFSLLLIVLRIAWMFPAAALVRWIRTRVLKQAGQRFGHREVFVLGWTGMRGVVALAAAISLPETLADGEPFVQRNFIIFLTFAVILVTLVFQGLTLPWLVRRLGLSGTGEKETEELDARRTMLQAAIDHLREGEQQAGGELAQGYEDLLRYYTHRLNNVNRRSRSTEKDSSESTTYFEFLAILDGTLAVERVALLAMRNTGQIGDEVLRHLERELDLTDARQNLRLR